MIAFILNNSEFFAILGFVLAIAQVLIIAHIEYSSRKNHQSQASVRKAQIVIRKGHPLMSLPHQGVASGNISMWTRIGSRCGVPAVDVITRENIF